MTGIVGQFSQAGSRLAAFGTGLVAARMETAALGHIVKGRHLAGDGVEPFDIEADPRYRGQQRFCIGVSRGIQYLSRGSLFHDLAGVHDGDPVGDLRDDPQVVRDQQDAHPVLGAQFVQQTEDLCLDGDIQRGRRLIGHQQFGTAGQRHRDHGALFHATGKLVRIFIHPQFRRGDAHLLQRADALLTGRPFGLMQGERFHDLRADRHGRVQRQSRILKNVADPFAADAAQFFGAEGKGVAALQQDTASQVFNTGNEPGDALGGDALAAAAFAYQTDDLAGVYTEGEILHRAQKSVIGLETETEVFYLEQRFRHDKKSFIKNRPYGHSIRPV